MSGLSSQQRIILRWLLYHTRLVEQADPRWLEGGIAWVPQSVPKTNEAFENVWRASLCRSLARLENRGLITRIKGRKKARTLRVLLTPEGRKVVESLPLY